MENMYSLLLSMFHHLFRFSYQRTPFQAAGFYLASLLGVVLVSGILGVGISLLASSAGFAQQIGEQGGMAAAMLFVALLTGTLIVEKRLQRHIPSLLIAILCLPLTYLGGSFLGLVIPAAITTIPRRIAAN
jgi:hypothetical protein